jgi:hypothetical protein
MTRAQAQLIADKLMIDVQAHYHEQARLIEAEIVACRASVDQWLASGAYRRKYHERPHVVTKAHGLSFERSANEIRARVAAETGK